MGRILKTAEAFGEIQKGLSFGMGNHQVEHPSERPSVAEKGFSPQDGM